MLSRLTPLRIGGLLGIVFALLRLLPLDALDRVTARAVDSRLASRGAIVPNPEIVIVAIDNDSLDAVGRWPWPRATVARLVDRIAAAGAAVIGFDLIQSEPAADDALLVESVGRLDQGVLGYYFDFSHNDPASLETRVSTYTMVWNAPADLSALSVPSGTSIRRNLPELSAAARHLGYFNFQPDSDGSYRRATMVIRANDRFALPLSLAMLKVYRPDWNLGLRFRGDVVDSVQLGPTTIPLAEDGQLLINYRGPGYTFPHLTASRVLAGETSPDELRGRIVLLGVTATAVADVRVTPFDGLMPGVEIHANIIDSIMSQDFLSSSKSQVVLIESLLILVLSLAVGTGLSFARGLYGFVLAAVLGLAFYFGSQWLFLSTGLCLSLLLPMLAIGLTYGGVSLQHFLAEEQSKRQVRDAFELYVTPHVARLVSNHPELLTLSGETRELSVMFLDIRGFTTISERMSQQPQELVALLNRFLDAMTHVILDHDGTLDKYVGDEIMAFWGAPLPQSNHADLACKAAVALIARLVELNREFVDRGWPPLGIGVGIHSGPMVVGNMGSSRRLCYTVVGDNVNLAARLEGLNRKYGTQIIASAATMQATEVPGREVDVVRVRGKDEAVHVFEILTGARTAEEWDTLLPPFAQGLGHYRQQRWSEARACFTRALSICPDDAPSQLYLLRIAEFERNPPSNWDGVTVMETK